MRPPVSVDFTVDETVQPLTEAPCVILSNCLGATLSMWDAQVRDLVRRFRVIRYDTRGHGNSPVALGPYTIDDLVNDVLALLDHLGLRRVHFVGLSLGGMTGLRLAARHSVDLRTRILGGGSLVPL